MGGGGGGGGGGARRGVTIYGYMGGIYRDSHTLNGLRVP